ncbi:FAD-dependent oxidoreductase [Verrucomicrobiales bacterium]|nr:FAD-dependent oxidoreductase [Verrucomicrobiales bacterium]
MIRFIPLSGIVIALLALANIKTEAVEDLPDVSSTNPEANDVVVVGGTPAGVAAAIAAGRAGKTVILIEQSPVLGGMNASGVIRLDDLYVESNSGVMEEFRQRVKAYHRTELAEDPLVKAHLTRDPRFPWNVADGRAWEPHTAARIYAEMVAELDTITTRLNEVPVDVEMNENRVTGVITQDRDNQGSLGKKQAYTGKVIIDATYEADLAEFAKIPYRTGREARSDEEPHREDLHQFLSRCARHLESHHSPTQHRGSG